MSIKFACTCGKAYKVPEKFSGKRVKCKKCGEHIRVPSQSEPGVASSRASTVSKRSVLASQRLDAKGSRSSSRRSGERSSRSSKRSGRSERTSAKSTKVRKSKPGSKTERMKPPDLQKGNKAKAFARKKEEEFAKGVGRLTYFEDGKPKKAYRIQKGKDAMVGRDEGCGVQLSVSSVSGEHMKIEYKLGTFIATDQQSTNGIVINGRTVRRTSLRNGDIIQLGDAILRLDCS